MHIPAVAHAHTSCGHAPTSIDDEPGAVTAGGYGIDPQGEAGLLAEV